MYEWVIHKKYINGVLVSETSELRKRMVKVKIDQDPNEIRHDIRCPCCGITVRRYVEDWERDFK